MTAPASGLQHHVLEWDGGGHTLLVLHGFLDCAASFAALVSELPEELHVVAPDLRGHGRTEHVGPGGAYHFFDYVRDVRDLVDRFRCERLSILGHSMGGGVAQLFAGTWPSEVHRLVLAEGLGPPREDPADAPARLLRWVRESREWASRGPRHMASREEVLERLRQAHPRAPAERLDAILDGLARQEPGGGWTWRHDPLHRVRSPSVYRAETYAPFLSAIACPVLLVDGAESWYEWEDLPERRARLRDWRLARVPGAGHMLHLDAPAAFAAAAAPFLTG